MSLGLSGGMHIKTADKEWKMRLHTMGRIYFAWQYKGRKEFSCSDFHRPVSLCMTSPHPQKRGFFASHRTFSLLSFLAQTAPPSSNRLAELQVTSQDLAVSGRLQMLLALLNPSNPAHQQLCSPCMPIRLQTYNALFSSVSQDVTGLTSLHMASSPSKQHCYNAFQVGIYTL